MPENEDKDRLEVIYEPARNYVCVRKGLITVEGDVNEGVIHFEADKYDLLHDAGISLSMITDGASEYLKKREKN